MQRYYYYINKGIKKEMLAPTAPETMQRVRSMIPNPLLQASHLQLLLRDLDGEVEQDYDYSVRKAIGEQLTKDASFLTLFPTFL